MVSDSSPSAGVQVVIRPSRRRLRPLLSPPIQRSPARSASNARTSFLGRPSSTVTRRTTRPPRKRATPPPSLPTHSPPSGAGASARTSGEGSPSAAPKDVNSPSR